MKKVKKTKKTKKTNITGECRTSFELIRDPNVKGIALFSCFVNGEPTSAIVSICEDSTDPGSRYVVPLFVAITPGMVLTNHDGEPPEHISREMFVTNRPTDDEI